MILSLNMKYRFQLEYSPPKTRYEPRGGGGGTWVFFGWVCTAGTPNWHPVLKKNSPEIDIPF